MLNIFTNNIKSDCDIWKIILNFFALQFKINRKYFLVAVVVFGNCYFYRKMVTLGLDTISNLA